MEAGCARGRVDMVRDLGEHVGCLSAVSASVGENLLEELRREILERCTMTLFVATATDVGFDTANFVEQRTLDAPLSLSHAV